MFSFLWKKGTFSFHELELKCNLSNILLLIREKMVKKLCGGHCGCFYSFSWCVFTANWQLLLFRKIPLFPTWWNDWVFLLFLKLKKMQQKENMFPSKKFVDHLIFVLFSLTSCYKDLKLFSLEFAILVFFYISHKATFPSHCQCMSVFRRIYLQIYPFVLRAMCKCRFGQMC